MDAATPEATRPFSFDTLGGRQDETLHLAASPEAPLVLVLPALGLRAAYYAPLVSALVREGLHAAAIDVPGHGASPVRAARGVDWGYPEVAAHAAAARAAACAWVPGAPVFWLGHSIGGQVALLDSGLHPGVHGVALVASGTPFWRAWEGAAALRIRVLTTVSTALAAALGYFPGERVGFGGREARGLIRQWAQLARTGSYMFEGFDGEAVMGAGRAPVLALRIVGDDLAPEAAVEHALTKLRERRVVREVWEGLPSKNVHNRWPRTPEHAAARVGAFVRSVLTGELDVAPTLHAAEPVGTRALAVAAHGDLR
ncbi:MAG: alpha/beta fold hydrolase [Polyangiales bacterium]|nr:alpha/beta fold hydrolase [Myxococcales bacterium]MCA9574893.1 alpha/beta fold hydrolase [Myxococcales bacterium]MCB9660177.1 alpha/beta fold hydrolase [Sandaracinaceae bacterium]